MKDKFIAAVVQQIGHAEYEANITAQMAGIREAHRQGAELVLLQELHNAPYFCQQENADFFDLAESIPGKSTEIYGALAKELKTVIVTSLFEKRAPGIYHNTAVVIDSDGGIAGKYRKMHIPDDPHYYEKFYFTPGDLGFTPINCSLGKLGVLVCWDQWFPEAARLMALKGVDILLYPTAIGWISNDPDEALRTKQREAWMLIQRSHAVANGLPVVVCNRIGFEAEHINSDKGIQFWGSSFIAGPQGEFLVQAPIDKPAVLVSEICKQTTESVRRGWPYFRDRRIDAYEGLEARYLAP